MNFLKGLPTEPQEFRRESHNFCKIQMGKLTTARNMHHDFDQTNKRHQKFFRSSFSPQQYSGSLSNIQEEQEKNES